MPLDLSDDYLVFDGTETVTYTPPGGAADSVSGALKQPVKVQDSNGAWIISGTQCVWILPGDELASNPVSGGTITEGATVWTITDAEQPSELTNMWVCNCVKNR